MAFKGEIAVGLLNSKFKYGFTTGDIYRVQGSGNLIPNNLAVKPGEFVEWYNGVWRIDKKMEYAVSKDGKSLDEVATNMLDDRDAAGETEEFIVTSARAAAYAVGHYYATAKEIFLCTAKTNNGDGTFTIEGTKKNGIVPVINELVDRIVALED